MGKQGLEGETRRGERSCYKPSGYVMYL
ncbi:uncharacterized protein FRV6_14333 [Fusarium oxysporum]|uniref:Uncharacterized protein n=1 Tax=Fusarium oxysporum TaxID=5507 RepID=A0A2H3TRA4_FUSOX|nr:uncharacterized protein FRV6_14333 [Fusarium oxysporum]